MNDRNFLSADIDPAKNINLKEIQKQALGMIHEESGMKQTLHDDAVFSLSNEFNDMSADGFLKQFRTYCLILDVFEEKGSGQEMVELLSTLLRAGIYSISGEAIDAVTVRRDAVQFDIDGRSTIIGSVNAEFLNILSLGKEGCETDRRLTVIEQLIKKRDSKILEAVSTSFKMPLRETEEITLLVQDLFDSQGNFIRKKFEAMLDDLARQGNDAFELLWCHFKIFKGNVNRVSFLNAMQHLISRIKRPKHALRFLLADFCRHPDKVEQSDRNAIMLANILLRTYNKELDVDIEMTPEEVLNVRNGLDKSVIQYAQFRIDSIEYRFCTKVRTIHENLVALLNTLESGEQNPSIRNLLFLEREIFIFLSLLSGKTAHVILTSALSEYGHPIAGIYPHLRNFTYLAALLQHLKIIVRGVGRVGNRDDVGLLKKIKAYGSQLSDLDGTAENRRSMHRIVDWIDSVIRNIGTTNWDSL